MKRKISWPGVISLLMVISPFLSLILYSRGVDKTWVYLAATPFVIGILIFFGGMIYEIVFNDNKEI